MVYFVNFGSLCFILLHFASIRLTAGLWAELFNNFGELFHNFGELFHIIGELLTNWVLTILEDLVNFGKFWIILLHLHQLGSSNFGKLRCILVTWVLTRLVNLINFI